MEIKSFKEISHCKKCGSKNMRGENPRCMFCPVCKPPRTGRVEKEGDREKLEKLLKKIHQNETTTHSLPKKKHIDEKTLKKLEKLAKKIREEESKIFKKINKNK